MARFELAYEPQPKQVLLHTTVARQILYGGAAGGGKSHCIRWDAIGKCLHNPGCQAFLFRRTTVQLRRNHINVIKGELPPAVGQWIESEKVFRFHNGSQLHFCYCENEADLENYQGAEFHWLGIDEAGQFTQNMIVYLRARVRLGGWKPVDPGEGMASQLPRICMSANPGGVGHHFLKSVFIDKAPAGSLFWDNTMADEKDDEDLGWRTIFIPARMDDNAYLDGSYGGQFTLMQDHLKKMLRDGDWDVVPGAFFDCWDRSEHVVPDFAIPSHWTVFLALDWGHATPFSVGWWAVSDGEPVTCKDGSEIILPDGCMVRYREWYGAQTDKLTGLKMNKGLKLDGAAVAFGIKQRTGEKIAYCVADPQFSRSDGGPSPAEMARKAGLSSFAADRERKAGWQEMFRRLKNGMLVVQENCVDFIRTVPVLQAKEDDIEDVLKEGEDHVGDEARYACMSRPWTGHKPLNERIPHAWTIDGLIKQAAKTRSARQRI